MSKSDLYGEGYWERGEGSNYIGYGDDPGWPVVLDVVQRYAPPPAVIREVACAKGYFVLHAMRRGYNARGIDVSEYAISKAPNEVRPYVEVADAVSLPWGDEEADVLCAFEFFEHVEEHEVWEVLQEMIRVMRPGGLLVLKTGIIVPSDHPFAGQEDHDHTHVLVRDRAWWEQLFVDNGLWHVKTVEDDLDEAFRNRDWLGRWFVWRKPVDSNGVGHISFGQVTEEGGNNDE